MIRRRVRPVLAAAALALAGVGPASAEDRAGDFDYYVLTLSWSPSWCEAEPGAADSDQCASGRPYAFVVHGLWPQYDRGWPEYCDPPGDDRPSRRDVDAMLDIMPDPGLVRHQWRKHGACSGLEPGEYLDTVRAAYEAVSIPPALRRLDRYTMVAPRAVEKAFVAANPGLAPDGIAVTCDSRRLREVRICLTRGLDFTDCPDVDRRGCRAAEVVMPPVR
jgi:ribonuclease T2